jgi:capsular exopolysaccharide synthesis family protein
VTRLREALDRATAERDVPEQLPPPSPAPDNGEGVEQPWQLGEDVASAPAEADEPSSPWRLTDAPLRPPANAAGSHRPTDEDPSESVSFQRAVATAPFTAKLVVRPGADTTMVEQFRRLAAALHHAQRQTNAHTVMIASAVEKEGKTLTSSNLALTLSQSYERRVLLVDADLRRPGIHATFGLDNLFGLGNVLRDTVGDKKLPVHQVSARLWVMTAGPAMRDPMGALVSDTMKQFLVDAAEQFDWILIDTPPVALLPDANLLAAMIDTALLVVSANTTPYPLAMRAVEAIGPARILGVVLNRAERSELVGGYGYYEYGYAPHPPDDQSRRRRFRLAFSRKE